MEKRVYMLKIKYYLIIYHEVVLRKVYGYIYIYLYIYIYICVCEQQQNWQKEHYPLADQPSFNIKFDWHARGKWLTQDTKHRKDNQLRGLQTCEVAYTYIVPTISGTQQ